MEATITFDKFELEMIQDLVQEHKNNIGYGVYYGDEDLNQEYKQEAESILNKIDVALTKFCK